VTAPRQEDRARAHEFRERSGNSVRHWRGVRGTRGLGPGVGLGSAFQAAVIWHLINDPDARFHDLGADHHRCLAGPVRKTRDLVRELERLGRQVTLAPVTDSAA
jgi:hypothetical protein